MNHLELEFSSEMPEGQAAQHNDNGKMNLSIDQIISGIQLDNQKIN